MARGKIRKATRAKARQPMSGRKALTRMKKVAKLGASIGQHINAHGDVPAGPPGAGGHVNEHVDQVVRTSQRR